MTSHNDTIVAIATPPGVGGIGIVRLSGDQAADIAERILGGLPEPRTATRKLFLDPAGRVMDEGVALYYPAPNSYTGEAVVELQGHGGPAVLNMVLEASVALGARRAEPGEFSRRAFLNDKLDLAQAEAIADLINSGTEQAARAALRSLQGAFSSAVDSIAAQLLGLRTYVEATIDFPDDEVDLLNDTELQTRLKDCAASFRTLNERAKAGRVLRDGYRVVIAGAPNAGKSSLMNRLSGEDTAIVTEVAGTTRDILREQINIDGLAVELMDTAGLRDNPDRVEREGIRRAREAMQSADAVLWIADATMAKHETDPALYEILHQAKKIPVTYVYNKVDLTNKPAGLVAGQPANICVSALTGAGIDVLCKHIAELAGHRDFGEGAFTARQRQLDALQRAQTHFDTGREMLGQSRATDILAEELRLAHAALGEITGTVTSDELLGEIFGSFCIGK